MMCRCACLHLGRVLFSPKFTRISKQPCKQLYLLALITTAIERKMFGSWNNNSSIVVGSKLTAVCLHRRDTNKWAPKRHKSSIWSDALALMPLARQANQKNCVVEGDYHRAMSFYLCDGTRCVRYCSVARTCSCVGRRNERNGIDAREWCNRSNQIERKCRCHSRWIKLKRTYVLKMCVLFLSF